METAQPATQENRNPLVLPLVLLALGIALRVLIFGKYYHVLNDDAYIFLRYSRNLAEGHGLLYNPGEWVMGFTSTLYPILVAPLLFLSSAVSAEWLVNGLNLGLFCLVAWLIFRLRSEPGPRIPFGFVFWVFFFPFIDASLNGMETMLFLCFVFGCAYAASHQKWELGAFLAGASLLVRPEGACLAASFAIAYFLSRPLPKFPWKGLGASLICVGAWAVLATKIYGSPLPNSMLAKSRNISAALIDSQVSSLKIIQSLALGLSSDSLGSQPKAAIVFGIASLLILAGTCWWLTQLVRQRSASMILPCFALAVMAFYLAGHPVRIWSWYSIPPFAAIMWTLADMVDRLVASKGYALAATCAAGLCVASIGLGVPGRVKGLKRLSVPLERVASRIQPGAGPEKSVLIGDIGILGYRTNLKVYDVANLVTKSTNAPEVGAEMPSMGSLIERFKPDYIVLKNRLPSTGPVVESMVRRQSFKSPAQWSEFRRNYKWTSQPGELYQGCYERL